MQPLKLASTDYAYILFLRFQDMSNTTPLVFVLSPGSDPFSALQKFATERGCAGKLVSVSLGQGQGPVAEKVIATAALKGDWVFLQVSTFD